MNSEPIRKRHYAAFLSHSSKNKPIVREIHAWAELAGISIWYDEDALAAGMDFVSMLGDAIPQCRAMLLVISEESLASGWVRNEFNFAIDHQTRFPDFKIIPIVLDNSDPPNFINILNHIKVEDNALGLDFYDRLLKAFYSGDIALRHGIQRDIYASYGWRDSEAVFTETVLKQFAGAQFRLVGDYKDHPSFTENHERILDIMESCGGLVAVAPYRETEAEHGYTSRYIWREVEMASQSGLPCVLVAEKGVQVPPEIEQLLAYQGYVSREELSAQGASSVSDAVEVMRNRWKEPKKEHYIFFATDLDNKQRNTTVMPLIERITGMRCYIGDDIHAVKDSSVQQEIVKAIQNAYLCIGDISEGNINTLIEMGIARGAGVQYRLIAGGQRQRPPFMFFDNEVFHYSTDSELLARIHRLVHPYRRYIVNSDLPV